MVKRDDCKDFGNRLNRAIANTVKDFLMEHKDEAETIAAIKKMISTTEITIDDNEKCDRIEIEQRLKVSTRLEDIDCTSEKKEETTSEFEKDLNKMIKNLIEKYGNE